MTRRTTPAGFPITKLRAGSYEVATPKGVFTISHEPTSLGGWLVQDKHDGDVVPTFAEAQQYVDATVANAGL